MKTKSCFCALVSLAMLFSVTSSARAITLGQVDDFQDGTTQGWLSGNPSPVPTTNAQDLGPLGIGDHSLLFATNGNLNGAGSKLITFNQLQWTGDYLAAGVTGISLDVNNLSGRDITLRLAIDDDVPNGGGGVGGRFATTTGFLLPAASGWQSLFFGIEPTDWTSVGGVDINATLADVKDFRLVDNVVPSYFGATGAAEVLVDNITALPEPSSLVLGSLAGLVILFQRRQHAA